MICKAMRLLIAILFYIFVDKHILSMLLNSKIHHRNFNGLCAWVCDDTTHTYMCQCLPTNAILNHQNHHHQYNDCSRPPKNNMKNGLELHPSSDFLQPLQCHQSIEWGQFYCVFRLVVATRVILMCLYAESINWEIVPNQAMQPLRHDSRKSLISIVPMRHNKVAVSKQFFLIFKM